MNNYGLEYPLSKILEVMKPCKVDRENPNHVSRLDQLMKTPRYIAEEKIDGCHYINLSGRFFSTRISTRTNTPVEKTENLPHLAEAIARLEMPQLVLDGEIFYPGQKSQDVITVTGSLPDEAIHKQEQNGWVSYKVFDVLRDTEGNWLFNTPWHERRGILEAVALQMYEASPNLVITSVIRDRKEQFLEHILEGGGEGIILKDVMGLYYPGTRPMWNWVKVKVETEDDVVIMGFEPPEKIYTGKDLEHWPHWEDGDPVTKFHHFGWIGAVAFGKYKEGELVKLGTTSGMDEVQRAQFTQNPQAFIGKVMKIKAMEQTRDGAYRHPAFVEMHLDKNPKECTL